MTTAEQNVIEAAKAWAKAVAAANLANRKLNSDSSSLWEDFATAHDLEYERRLDVLKAVDALEQTP